MSFSVRLALALAATIAWAAPAAAQVCHDRDGDLEVAGLECETAADCDDGLWSIRPGAGETCDGYDSDCDGAIDETCDRFCDTPDLYDIPRMLEFGPDYPLQQQFNTTEAFEFLPEGFLGLAETGTNDMRRLVVRPFDRWGQPAGALTTLDMVQGTSWRFETECDLTYGGGRHLALWYRDPPAGEPKSLFARVLDRYGRPIGPILDITELSGGRYVRAVTEWVGAFNGTDFAVFWTPEDATNELLMTTIGWDGSPESVNTVLVTDDVDGKRSLTQGVKSVWSGDRYVVMLKAGEAGDTVTMAVGRDGTILAGPHVYGFRSGPGEMIMDDRGPVAAFMEQTATFDYIHVLFLDPLTGAIRSPGPSFLTLPSSELLRASDVRLAWNGEMLGVAVSSSRWNGTLYEQAMWFWRVLPDGTVLDPQGIKLDDGTNWREPGVRKVGWDGSRFQIITRYANLKMARVDVICDCGDADGDQFDACINDCDDGDPQVNGLATEICTGGVDDDCDFLVDCADPDCPSAPGPVAVQDLAWTASGLAWSAGGGAQRWDLARGVLSDALRRGDFELAECVGRELASPSWPDDGRQPPKGDVLWYLVRPEGAPCARGPWSADGTPRETLVCD
ncbi:MAG: hypothetical protein Kow0062_01180 [Acidobacteriota bacterium]